MAIMPLDRPNTGIKMKLCSLKYTLITFRAALLWAKPDRIAFIPMFITDPMDAMIVLGRPTEMMPPRSRLLMLQSFTVIFSSGFFFWFSTNPIPADTNWPITVAIAAPLTPIRGKPSRPKIMMGSRIMLVRAPHSCVTMDSTELPVACSIRSWKIATNSPVLNTVTIVR